MHGLLSAITVVLCVAAVTTVVFQWLRQPVVLGYLLAGLLVGPHIPIPLGANREVIQSLSELGVILLMFSVGLELSIRKLVRVGPAASLTAIIQSSIMVWLGFLVGRAFGWTMRESVFAGAIIAISSTTIIAKVFDEQRIKGRLRELVVGVLVVEDLIAILLMTVLTALASPQGVSAGALARSSGRLAAFLVGVLAIGMLVVPRLVRVINRLDRPETTLVTSVGICFALALLAHGLGYSVALGAFIAGSLVAESGEEKQIEHLIVPVRDLFAAIFFVSVGMLIDPAMIADHWVAVLVLSAVVIVGKVFGVGLGAFLTGNGTRLSVQAGMSLSQIGEFSFIIASLGITVGATRDFLYPVAVAVSALTTLTTPWLIRAAGPVASFIDHRLPGPLQTFAALYGSWIERLRASRDQTPAWKVRRLIRLVILDAALLAVLAIGAAIEAPAIADIAARELGLAVPAALTAIAIVTIVLAAPFAIGIARIARKLGTLLAKSALPVAEDGSLDLAAAPRRVFVVTLQLAVVLLVGLPVVAVTQPFLPGWVTFAALGLVLVLGVVFWRSATNLEGHVRAGAQIIVDVLATGAAKRTQPRDESLGQLRELLPGLGEPVPYRLDERSPAVGATLSQLDLRSITGASVLAIARGDGGVIIPKASEVLRASDVLALAGTHEAIEAAIALLEGRTADGGLVVGESGTA